MSKTLKHSPDFQAYIRGIVATQLHELDISHELDLEGSGMPEEGQSESWNFKQYLDRFNLDEEKVTQNVITRAIKESFGTPIVEYFLTMQDAVNTDVPVNPLLKDKDRSERWELVGKTLADTYFSGRYPTDFNSRSADDFLMDRKYEEEPALIIYFDWSSPEKYYIAFSN